MYVKVIMKPDPQNKLPNYITSDVDGTNLNFKILSHSHGFVKFQVVCIFLSLTGSAK